MYKDPVPSANANSDASALTLPMFPRGLIILIFYFYLLAVDTSLHPDGECALTVATSLTMILLSIERMRMPIGHLVHLYFLPVLPVAWT